MIYSRKPRFRRSSDIASISLTERDKNIIRFIHRHRFLRSSHLADLIVGSRQQLLRRLQALYHHGYLERPLCQLDYFQKGGSRSIIYGLSSRGAAFLRRVDNIPFSKIDWSGKNHSVKRVFLDHALMVSDIMVALELACRKRGDVRFLVESEIPLPEITRKLRNPYRWTVTVSGNEKFGVIPDRVFALEMVNKKECILFFLEADVGTMPIYRNTKKISSIDRKFMAYRETLKQGIHSSRFGYLRSRVLIVTKSSERTKNLGGAALKWGKGIGMILFSDLLSIHSSNDIFSSHWLSATGAVESLVDW